MMTETLTREVVQLHTGTDPADCSHYVKRNSIVNAVVFGNAVEALCGYVWVPSRDVRGLPICQGCKAIYDDDLAISLAAA